MSVARAQRPGRVLFDGLLTDPGLADRTAGADAAARWRDALAPAGQR